jgi:hypothetical protein
MTERYVGHPSHSGLPAGWRHPRSRIVARLPNGHGDPPHSAPTCRQNQPLPSVANPPAASMIPSRSRGAGRVIAGRTPTHRVGRSRGREWLEVGPAVPAGPSVVSGDGVVIDGLSHGNVVPHGVRGIVQIVEVCVVADDCIAGESGHADVLRHQPKPVSTISRNTVKSHPKLRRQASAEATHRKRGPRGDRTHNPRIKRTNELSAVLTCTDAARTRAYEAKSVAVQPCSDGPNESSSDDRTSSAHWPLT